MKNTILLYLFCSLFNNHKAQTFYTVYTPTLISQNASDVKVITKVSFGNSANTLNHSVSIDNINKKVNLISCYGYQPLLPSAPTLVSTVTIGALTTGNYDLNYTVFVVTNYTNCNSPSDTTANTYQFYAGPTNIQELKNNSQFKITPNPVKESFQIVGNTNSALEKIEIINILGDKVLETNNIIINTSIDVSLLTKGLYFVKIYSDKRTYIYKIIKE